MDLGEQIEFLEGHIQWLKEHSNQEEIIIAFQAILESLYQFNDLMY